MDIDNLNDNQNSNAGIDDRILELENNWKRALADYTNLQKRVVEEKAEMAEFSNMVLMEKLLPILDNFEMLDLHSQDQGIKLSVKDFRNVLYSAGLRKLEVSVGDTFDHTTMHAIELVEGNKDVITSVEQSGYFFKSRLIRPVSVKVGRGTTVDASQKMEE